jgi:hypothetical protein
MMLSEKLAPGFDPGAGHPRTEFEDKLFGIML